MTDESEKPGRMVVVDEEESDNAAYISNSNVVYQATANGALCSSGSQCTLLANCRLLKDLMDQTCLAPDKLRTLTCGYYGTEPLVCCPNGAANTPLTPTTVPSPPSAQTGTGFNGQCGQPLVSGTSGLGSQPWTARIGFTNVRTGKMTYPCCGSIISSRTILTAGHCALAKSDGYKLSSVKVGEYDSRGDPDCTRTYCAHPAQSVAVSHVIVHPGYESKIFKHDVALLVLKTSLNFSLAAQPVCILQNGNVPLVGRRGKLVGWGKLPGQETTPSREQQLELPIIALEKCSAVYGSIIPVNTNQMCVGGEEGKDACSGFGGAPLVLLDHVTRTKYYQVGMASFGSDKCGMAGIPSVYTNIQKYSEWIKNNMV
ncbi:CLIP domain-containing serine protease B4 [Anabrus simplex]|uniref:CLIP domain-containing serine protease B4 n=1 Tax=Anabrus simplex TaxID=316456 RepID=UPI0035A3A11C